MTSPFNSEFLGVEQVLNVKDQVNITLAVGAVSGPVLRRLLLLELRFPVPQYVCFQLRHFAHFAN